MANRIATADDWVDLFTGMNEFECNVMVKLSTGENVLLDGKSFKALTLYQTPFVCGKMINSDDFKALTNLQGPDALGGVAAFSMSEIVSMVPIKLPTTQETN